MITHRSCAGNDALAVRRNLAQLASDGATTEDRTMENRLTRLEVAATQLDNRLARVEVILDHVKEDVRGIRMDFRDLRSDVHSVRDQARLDFRLLFGALITMALGMATLMARGFHWI